MNVKSLVQYSSKVVALAAILAALSSAKAQESDQSVIAGQRVDVNKIGDSRAAQLRDMGKPSDHYSLPGGITVDSWGDGNTRAFYRHDLTAQITTRSLAAPLPGNISMESTVSQVLARHAGLKKHEYRVHGSGGGIIDYYDDQAHGIAFEFSHGMNPMPGGDNKPKLYAVIVHKVGMPVIPDIGETAANDSL